MPKLEALHNYVDVHKFAGNLTVDTGHNDSDLTEVSVHGWRRLHIMFDFHSTPAAADTDIITIELHESSTTTDTDFAKVGTDQFSLSFSPAADSDSAAGIVQVDLDLLRVGVTKKFVRPSLALAGTGASLTDVSIYGLLYNGSGVMDHESADTDVTVV